LDGKAVETSRVNVGINSGPIIDSLRGWVAGGVAVCGSLREGIHEAMKNPIIRNLNLKRGFITMGYE
jgi:hypothetical protein